MVMYDENKLKEKLKTVCNKVPDQFRNLVANKIAAQLLIKRRQYISDLLVL